MIVPISIKNAVMDEKAYGIDGGVHHVLFHLLKLLQPGCNPCRDPWGALKELRRWFTAMTRSTEIGMSLPGIDLRYRGARSTFIGALEIDYIRLRVRFHEVEQRYGFPNITIHEGLRAINDFALLELGAMVINVQEWTQVQFECFHMGRPLQDVEGPRKLSQGHRLLVPARGLLALR